MTTTRTPLVRADMPENTASARRLGAQILGRALAHAAIDDGISPRYAPRLNAVLLGFTFAEADRAVTAYRQLLWG